MITVVANARSAFYTSDDLLTSGSIGIPVTFDLSADFDDLSCVAVFKGSGASVDVALVGSACVVPHECVAVAGGSLCIGVYGRNAGGSIAIPTVWADAMPILQGAVPSGVDPSEPTPDWTAQVQAQAAEALELAQAVETAAENGDFDGQDGVSPSVAVTSITGGHQVVITDASGTETFDVMNGANGQDGQDGVSPTVSVTQITGGYRVSITDAQGTDTFDVMNGADGVTFTPSVSEQGVISWTNDGGRQNPASVNIKGPAGATGQTGPAGQDGADGYSPTASVSKSGTTATITITDKNGTTTASVSDGTDGVPGVGVPTGGTDGQMLVKDGSTDYSTKWANQPSVPVTDVQVNGTSVLSNGVANVPLANGENPGVVKSNTSYGVYVTGSGWLMTVYARSNNIKKGTDQVLPIVPYNQHESTFYGLAKAAGDSTQSASSNAVGTYTESAKSSIASMLNAPESVSGSTPSITAKAGVRYVCGECSTLDVLTPATGIIDVVFESGSTPTVLTITPPSGVTVKWANGFDPASLEANATYEINIADGLGVAAAWT